MKGDQKLGWTGMKLTEFDDIDWITSPEKHCAWQLWDLRLRAEQPFDQSKEFANARHAYRRRVNGTD